MLLSACGSAEAVNEGSGAVSDISSAETDIVTEMETSSETAEVLPPEIITESTPEGRLEETVPGGSEQPREESGDDVFPEYDPEAENAAMEKFERLVSSFSDSTEGGKVYPEDYCGAYYEDGSLFICLTDISEEAVKPYSDITGGDEVEFIKQEFSINYLMALSDYVVELMSDREWEINSGGLYQKDNRVGIGVGSQEALERLHAHLTEKGYPENSFSIEIEEIGILM